MTPPDAPTPLPDPDHGRLVHAVSMAACEADGLHQAVRRTLVDVCPADTTARLGGDEFVVVCERVDDAEVRALAGRIAAAVHTPFVVEAHELRVTASVGAVIAGPVAGDPQALLRDADAAMYRAKRSRPSRLVVVDRR